MYKVLICGDREWKKEYTIIVQREIKSLARAIGTDKLLIIEGGAPGVDSLAKLAAQKMNIHVAEVEALWDTRGRSAGPQRNKIMALLEPDEVIAIHSDISKSKGTVGMLAIAEVMEIPHRLVEA